MKNLIKSALFIMLVGVVSFVACDKENVKIESNEKNYEEFALLVKSDLNYLANELRTQKSSFNSKKTVLSIAEKYYGLNSNNFKEFSMSFSSESKNELVSNEKLSELITELNSILPLTNSSEEFIAILQSKFDEYSNLKLESNEKELILTYLISYKVAVEFISNNQDIIFDKFDNSKYEWWDSWGKCAAGTVGGAGAGALAGGAAASIIPILGTTAGLIIGGISGGLTGAAASC